MPRTYVRPTFPCWVDVIREDPTSCCRLIRRCKRIAEKPAISSFLCVVRSAVRVVAVCACVCSFVCVRLILTLALHSKTSMGASGHKTGHSPRPAILNWTSRRLTPRWRQSQKRWVLLHHPRKKNTRCWKTPDKTGTTLVRKRWGYYACIYMYVRRTKDYFAHPPKTPEDSCRVLAGQEPPQSILRVIPGVVVVQCGSAGGATSN